MKISSKNLPPNDWVDINYELLFDLALKVTKNSYAPYSHFRVGATLLLENGNIIQGVNIENRSYGLTNCAERTAIYTAVASGELSFKALAIATPDASYPVPPCGACRQVISEFMKEDAFIIFGNSKENIKILQVKELYPYDSLHELGSI